MISDTRTTRYAQPAVPLNAREHELHVWYASQAIARGHADHCDMVTTPRNWPHMSGRTRCSCSVLVSAPTAGASRA